MSVYTFLLLLLLLFFFLWCCGIKHLDRKCHWHTHTHTYTCTHDKRGYNISFFCVRDHVFFSLWLWIQRISLQTDKRALKFKAPHKTLLPPFPPQADSRFLFCQGKEEGHTLACDNTSPTTHNMDAKLCGFFFFLWPQPCDAPSPPRPYGNFYDIALLFNRGIITP